MLTSVDSKFPTAKAKTCCRVNQSFIRKVQTIKDSRTSVSVFWSSHDCGSEVVMIQGLSGLDEVFGSYGDRKVITCTYNTCYHHDELL